MNINIMSGDTIVELITEIGEESELFTQVQEWKEIQLDPLQYGWKRNSGKLHPTTGYTKTAPVELIKLVSCKCVTGCKTRLCGCRQIDSKCTSFCQCKDCDNLEAEYYTPSYNDSGDEDNGFDSDLESS